MAGKQARVPKGRHEGGRYARTLGEVYAATADLDDEYEDEIPLHASDDGGDDPAWRPLKYYDGSYEITGAKVIDPRPLADRIHGWLDAKLKGDDTGNPYYRDGRRYRRVVGVRASAHRRWLADRERSANGDEEALRRAVARQRAEAAAEHGACERAHDPFHGLSDDERHARMTWSLHEEAVARGDTESPFHDMNI